MSSFKGVTAHRKNWRAELSHDDGRGSKNIKMGTFPTPELAAKAFDIGLYLIKGVDSGPNMGPLTAAEKLELDATTLEAWKESHGVKKAFSKGSSAYRGVNFDKGSNKFKAAIWDKTKGGKNIYLGSFTDELDAANAYDAAALRMFGHKAKLNWNLRGGTTPMLEGVDPSTLPWNHSSLLYLAPLPKGMGEVMVDNVTGEIIRDEQDGGEEQEAVEGEEGDEDEDYDDDESVLSEESAEDEVDVRWKRAVANNRTLPGRFEREDTIDDPFEQLQLRQWGYELPDLPHEDPPIPPEYRADDEYNREGQFNFVPPYNPEASEFWPSQPFALVDGYWTRLRSPHEYDRAFNDIEVQIQEQRDWIDNTYKVRDKPPPMRVHGGLYAGRASLTVERLSKIVFLVRRKIAVMLYRGDDNCDPVGLAAQQARLAGVQAELEVATEAQRWHPMTKFDFTFEASDEEKAAYALAMQEQKALLPPPTIVTYDRFVDRVLAQPNWFPEPLEPGEPMVPSARLSAAGVADMLRVWQPSLLPLGAEDVASAMEDMALDEPPPALDPPAAAEEPAPAEEPPAAEETAEPEEPEQTLEEKWGCEPGDLAGVEAKIAAFTHTIERRIHAADARIDASMQALKVARGKLKDEEFILRMELGDDYPRHLFERPMMRFIAASMGGAEAYKRFSEEDPVAWRAAVEAGKIAFLLQQEAELGY